MKTPEKNPKKQGTRDMPGSKATTTNKNPHDSGKGPWKDPDPTDPRKSPEKINEPYAGTKSTPEGKSKSQPVTGIKKEKVTNAGESEHHIPVNKSDYDKYEEDYDDVDLDEEEEDDEEEDEDGEANSTYENEDEHNPLNRKNKLSNLKNQTLQQKQPLQQKTDKMVENKNKSQLPSNSTKKNNPQS